MIPDKLSRLRQIINVPAACLSTTALDQGRTFILITQTPDAIADVAVITPLHPLCRLVQIDISISTRLGQHNDLEKALMELIHKYDLTPDMLNLEITESLFLDKPEELNRVLDRLQKLGFKLEVDDFGSGFSSLNLIRNISVDTIKIDKEFLDSEIASEKGKIVVNHTIGMAKDLHLQVIAEGVETKAHVDFLKNSNCDIAQGFYFAKPMPVPEFERIAF